MFMKQNCLPIVSVEMANSVDDDTLKENPDLDPLRVMVRASTMARRQNTICHL